MCTWLLQNHVHPGLNPVVAVGDDLLRREGSGLLGSLCIPGELFWQSGIRIYRIDKHLQGNIFLECCAQHKVHEFFGERTVSCPLEDTDKLNLTEAGIRTKDGSGGCIL